MLWPLWWISLRPDCWGHGNIVIHWWFWVGKICFWKDRPMDFFKLQADKESGLTQKTRPIIVHSKFDDAAGAAAASVAYAASRITGSHWSCSSPAGLWLTPSCHSCSKRKKQHAVWLLHLHHAGWCFTLNWSDGIHIKPCKMLNSFKTQNNVVLKIISMVSLARNNLFPKSSYCTVATQVAEGPRKPVASRHAAKHVSMAQKRGRELSTV